MIIKSIKLTNFRQFKDEHLIEFSTDRTKNVTVVEGKNTGGKTTIVCAFIWCLYGVNNLPGDKTLLNNIVKKNLTSYSSKDVSVEVVLNHENRDYIILRTQRWQMTSTGDSIRGNTPELKVSYIDENGETNSVNPAECQSVIESILPEALADYFFFDGERIKKLHTKSNVVSAVRGLMGLDVYSSGMDHLNPNRANSVIGVLKKELDTGKDAEAARRKAQIQEYKEKLESFQNHTPEIENQIEHFKYRKEELAQTLKDNEDVKKSQELKEKLEREEKYFTDLITKSEDRFISDFNSNGSKFFALPLIKKGLEILSSAKEEGAGIPNMHASSIDYILKRGKCICGCDLTKNQGAVECIQHEQKLLPPQHIGTSVRMFKAEMNNALQISNMFADNVKGSYDTWLNSQFELERKTKELQEVSKSIRGFVNIEKIELEYQEADRQYRRYLDAKQGNRDNIIRLTAQIDENEKEIFKLFATNDKNRKIMKYCDYAEAIYEWFRDYYDTQEKAVKDELLQSINYNFSKLYHGSRTIIMDNNYKITPVLTGTSDELSMSEGLEAITSFSFIMGLVELARKRAQTAEENGDESQKVTEPYPMVMDAPFSKVDSAHMKNLAERLPNVAEQVIIFVMDKDWDLVKDELGKKLGAKYTLEKVDNQDNNTVLRREI